MKEGIIMKTTKSKIISLAVALAIGTGGGYFAHSYRDALLIAKTVPIVSVTQITSDIILQTTRSWDGTTYNSYPNGQPEITVVRIQIPPNTKLADHIHKIPNVAYVEAGDLTVTKVETNDTLHAKKGETVPEMVNTVHHGVTGEQGVSLLVFYAGAVGIRLSDTE
jgi:quercetin dioxygenase-like cupin family protein